MVNVLQFEKGSLIAYRISHIAYRLSLISLFDAHVISDKRR